MDDGVLHETCTVVDEWAVLSEDGSVYQVQGRDRATAERELAGLRAGDPDDPERTPEPGAKLVVRVAYEVKGYTPWQIARGEPS